MLLSLFDLCVVTLYILRELPEGRSPNMGKEDSKHGIDETQHNESRKDFESPRSMSVDDIKSAVRTGSVPQVSKAEAMDIAKHGGWEADALISELEQELEARGDKKGFLDLEFKNPKYFTWMLVAFASMGGLLSGLDQSLISGANLFLPGDLGLTVRQNSLVNSAMPLGAVGGALILSPCNEYLGRRWSIIVSCILNTIGAALEAGSINYGMIIAARVILGFGIGLEGGTVPVYVAETVERRLRGNMVSLYQFNIALGEVLGYAVAAMFIHVEGNWRYILGATLIFSTIMGKQKSARSTSRFYILIPTLHRHRHAFPAGESSLPSSQAPHARRFQGLEACARYQHSGSSRGVLRHESQRRARGS